MSGVVIPAFNGGQAPKLGRLPGPVLDRVDRGSVNFSGMVRGLDQVQRSAEGLARAAAPVLMDPNMYAGELRGSEAVARGVAVVGEVIGKIAQHEAEAKNSADVADAELAMNRELTEFETWKGDPENMARPDIWAGEWNGRLSRLAEKFDKREDWSPDAKQRLGTAFTQFVGQSEMRVRVGAQRAQFGRAAKAADARFQIAESKGDVAGMVAAAEEEARFTGDPPEVAAAKVLDGKQRVHAKQRADHMATKPRDYEALMHKPAEERPEYMRDMDEGEMARDRAQIPGVLAGKRAAEIDLIKDDLRKGELVTGMQLYRRLRDGLYDPDRMLSGEDVRQIHKIINAPKANDPSAFVAMQARISDFDPADGDLGAANLKAEIRLHFDGDHEDALLKRFDETLKAPLNDMTRAKNGVFKEIDAHLSNGFFGAWMVPAYALTEDANGNLTRPALRPWEKGPQAIKLSQEDADAYDKAKKAGGASWEKLTIVDQNLKLSASRAAAGLMDTIEQNISSGSYKTAVELLDDYAVKMGAPAKERAQRVLDSPGDMMPPVMGNDLEQRVKAILGK
jgi:hypothetical protein